MPFLISQAIPTFSSPLLLVPSRFVGVDPAPSSHTTFLGLFNLPRLQLGIPSPSGSRIVLLLGIHPTHPLAFHSCTSPGGVWQCVSSRCHSRVVPLPIVLSHPKRRFLSLLTDRYVLRSCLSNRSTWVDIRRLAGRLDSFHLGDALRSSPSLRLQTRDGFRDRCYRTKIFGRI